jgi:hypothetical protein
MLDHEGSNLFNLRDQIYGLKMSHFDMKDITKHHKFLNLVYKNYCLAFTGAARNDSTHC